MEQRESNEKLMPRISPDEVWTRFEEFQLKAQEGFQTQAARFGYYGRFLHSLSTFLKQPELSDTDSAEKAKVVDKLFYHHEDVAPVPIGFCIDAKKRVQEEILDQATHQPLGERWNQELRFFSGITEAELHDTTLGFNKEKQAADRLRKLTEAGPKNEEELPVQQEVDAHEKRVKRVKETTLALLGKKDPELADDIVQSKRFTETLAGMVQEAEYSPDTIKENLEMYEDYLKKPDGSSWSDELFLRASIGQHETVRKKLQGILSNAQSIDFIWKKWAEKGHIPTSLLYSFQELTALIELQETAEIVKGTSPQTKAKALTPFIERGISAVMLEEIAEDKYEFAENFVSEQISSFMDFYDQYEKTQRKGCSLKRKIITAAIAGLIIASPFIYKNFAPQDNTPSEEINQIMQELSPEELAALQSLNDEQSSNPTGSEEEGAKGSGQDSGQSKAASGSEEGSRQEGSSGQQSDQQKQGSGQESGKKDDSYPVSQNFEKPKNNSPEERKQNEKIEMWNLSGRDLLGYYRSKTALRFDTNRQGWVVNRQYSPTKQMLQGENKNITISQTINIPGQFIELPGRENYKVTKGSVKITGEGVIYSVLQATDGTYFLYLSSESKGKTINITYDIGKADKVATPAPSENEIKEMKTKIADVNSFPQETKDFMRELSERKDLSSGAKAKIMEKYIKDNFLYSLNPQWSDYYHAGGSSRIFFKRVFEVKKADCDVANTALVALLRSQGISARMAFGFRHIEGVAKKPEKITASEAHGWVEAYIGGQWMTLDATPTKLDDYTKAALEKEGGSNSQEAQDIQTREDFARTIGSVSATLSEDETIRTLLLAELVNLTALGSSILLRRRNNAYADRLIKEVERRARLYTGSKDNYISSYLERRQTDKVRQDQDYERNAVGESIPPFALFALKNDIRHLLHLRKFPFKDSDKHIRQSEVPNRVEFLTEALGFPEDKARIGVYMEAYSEMYRQTKDEMIEVVDNIVVNYSSYHGGPIRGFCDKLYFGKLQKLPKPKTSEEWEETKKKTMEESYRDYTKAHNKTVKQLIKDSEKRKKTPELPTLVSREDFSHHMDSLFRYVLLLWDMDNKCRQAVKSASGK